MSYNLNNIDLIISKAQEVDIKSMNMLSNQKRISYEKFQPQFWRSNGDAGEIAQRKWFKELIEDNSYICLIAKQNDEIIGFVIGKIISAPEVYNPGGLTLLIDDFCILNSNWNLVGNTLLKEIKSISKQQGVTQLIAVSGSHDEDKKSFLNEFGFQLLFGLLDLLFEHYHKFYIKKLYSNFLNV